MAGYIQKLFNKLIWDSSDPISIAKRSRAMEVDDFEFNYLRESGVTRPSGNASFDDYLETYGVCGWVYIAVRVIASSLAQIPLRLWEREGSEKREKWQEIFDHPILTLIHKPNPMLTEYELKFRIGADLMLVGNYFMEVVSNGTPKELYPLLPQRVNIIPDPEKFIKGFTYTVNGKFISFGVEEIWQAKLFAAKNQYYGMSPLRAAQLSVIGDINSAVYNKNFFENSARPDGVLQTKEELSDSVFKRLKREWDKSHKGVGKAHRTAILESGLEWKPMAMTAKDMEFINTRKLSREEILAIYGVPPVMAGLLEYSNYSSAVEQRRQFWEQTMVPLVALIEGRLNAELVSRFKDKNLYLEFDMSQVPALRESKEAEARIGVSYISSGIMMINEFRQKVLGLESVPWGDTWWVPAGVSPYSENNTLGGMKPTGVLPGPDDLGNSIDQSSLMTFPSQDGIGKRLLLPAGEVAGSINPFTRARMKLLRDLLNKRLEES